MLPPSNLFLISQAINQFTVGHKRLYYCVSPLCFLHYIVFTSACFSGLFCRLLLSLSHLKQQINMDPLHIHRQAHRLTLMYKITNNYIDIDPHTYLHSTNNQRTRNTHNQIYQTYYANTDSYKHSYFPRTIRDWNRLPQHILNSSTIDSFTKQIHMHLSPQHPNTNTHT